MINPRILASSGSSPAAKGHFNRLVDDAAWRQVLPMLRFGRLLVRRDTRLFYVDGLGGITPQRVARLARQGVLQMVGTEIYALAREP